MPKYEPKYENGTVIENELTDTSYTILNREYNKDLCDIVYKVQNRRYDFDFHEIPESTIRANVESGNYSINNESS